MSSMPKLAGRGQSLENRADQLAVELLTKGQKPEDVLTQVAATGLSYHVARRIVTEANEGVTADLKRRAFRGVILGAAVLIAGGGVAYVSKVFDIRSPYDFIGYGIIAYGAFSMFISAWAYHSNRT